MSDKKISQLTASTTPLSGAESLPIVQGGTTVKVAVSNLTAGRAVSVLSLASTNDSTINGLRIGFGNNAVSTNTAFGYQALNSITTGGNSVGIGYLALRKATTGIYNVALGFDCLSNLVTGSTNTSIGGGAGSTLTSGSNNVFFGFDAQPSAATVSNEYTYGNTAVTKHRFVGGNIVIGTAGKGIDFSADGQAAGMTSELLDDYEEGTWTPTDDSGAGLTFTLGSCTYTKIGRMVTVYAVVTYPTTADVSNAKIAGFPFNPSDRVFGQIAYTDKATTVVNFVQGSGAFVFLWTPGALVTNAAMSGGLLIFSASYNI